MTSTREPLPLEQGNPERGSALIVVMVVIFMLMLLAAAVTGVSVTRSKSAVQTQKMVPAQGLAEAGVGVMLAQLERSQGTDVSPVTLTCPDGTATATATLLVNDIIRIESVGTTPGVNGTVIRIEAFLQSSDHPFTTKAIYVGNKDGITGTDMILGPDNQGNSNPAGSETPETLPYVANPNQWQSNWYDDEDYVHGDIYVNGHLRLKGDTRVWGDIDTTNSHIHGDVVGSPYLDPEDGMPHQVTTDVDPLDPPKLAVEDYENLPGVVVLDDPTNIPADLAGVFYQGRDTSDGLYTGAAGVQDNNRIFHMSPHTGGSAVIDFDPTQHNGKIFYIKGNLWLHNAGHKILRFPLGEDVQVTIIVEGNYYISDDLNYGVTAAGSQTLTNSGMLLIAKGTYTAGPDGVDATEDDLLEESFVDENKNYVYDAPNDGPDGIAGNGDDFAGEQIINDAGTIGTYEGRAEGIGNIYFGDASFGTGGVTNGFMYAENNGYLTEPPGNVSNNLDKIYGVYGFLSAGGILDLGVRDSGTQYRNYKVMYNPALANGSLNLAGIPASLGGGFKGLEVVAWRIMANGE